MEGKRNTEELIIRIQGEVVSGKTVAAVCRHYGRWRSKYRVIRQLQLKRLKQLEAEKARLNAIVAERAMDLDALKDLPGSVLKGANNLRWTSYLRILHFVR